MIKLLATDMDGTLLDDESNIPFDNKEYIIKAQSRNHKFALISGRPTATMIKYSKELKMDMYDGYIIPYNGVEIIEAKTLKSIYRKIISKKEMEIFYNLAKKHNISLVTYIDNLIYIYNVNEYSLVEPYITNLDYREFKSMEDIDILEYPKCMLVASKEEIDKIQDDILKEYGKLFYIARFGDISLEIFNKDVNKGKTLEKLCEILNIDKENSIVAGDSYNDIDLLKSAGIPVAVNNAVDDIKKIAKYVSVDNNNSAWADIIKKYVGV